MTTDMQATAAAVRELVRAEEIRRLDLIVVVDKHNAPFKPVLRWLERLEVIPFGTYEEIMFRCGTVRVFREKVQILVNEE